MTDLRKTITISKYDSGEVRVRIDPHPDCAAGSIVIGGRTLDRIIEAVATLAGAPGVKAISIKGD